MSEGTRQPKRRTGLTLIEVMLVLVILVVIASMAVVAIGPMRKQSLIRAARAQIEAFRTPLDAYQLDLGNFPNTSQGLEALRTAPSDVKDSDKWHGPYLGKAVPKDPWGNPYKYEYPGKNSTDAPDIWSYGPDGIDNTEDDVCSWKE